MKIKAIVLTGYGTNCEREMAHACTLAGFDQVDIVHASRLLTGQIRLDGYHFLNLPGGFLDGDDLGAAKAGANRILHARIESSREERLYDQFVRFIEEGKLILGVCNGFQLQVKLGMLPGFGLRHDVQTVTLAHNDSGRFEDRWVYLRVNPDSPCIFTRNIEKLYLPVRHGEGKLLAANEEARKRLHQGRHVVCQYSSADCLAPSFTYPENPNGSLDAIAGICNETGRIFGLMPHPEAYLHYTNHPRWTRETLPEEGMGLGLFKNAAGFLRSGEF